MAEEEKTLPEGEEPEVEETEEPVIETIPKADFLAYKKASEGREKKAKEQVTALTTELAGIKVDLEVASKTGGTDEEVKEVQEFLVAERKRVAILEANVNKERADVQTMYKAARVKELVTEYGIEASEFEDEEDYEVAALKLYANKLTEEKKNTPAPKKKSAFENANPATSAKKIEDMTEEEREKWAKKSIEKTLAKRGY